jgi:hypothetical protein
MNIWYTSFVLQIFCVFKLTKQINTISHIFLNLTIRSYNTQTEKSDAYNTVLGRNVLWKT